MEKSAHPLTAQLMELADKVIVAAKYSSKETRIRNGKLAKYLRGVADEIENVNAKKDH